MRGCQPLPVPRVPHQSVGDPVALVLGAAPPTALVIRVTPAPTCSLMLEALRPVGPAQLLLCLVLGGPEGQVVLLLVVAPPAPSVHSLHGLHSLSLELRPAASRGRLVTLLDVIARVLFNLEISTCTMIHPWLLVSPLVSNELDTWLLLAGRCPLSSLTRHRSYQLHIRNAKLVAVAVNILTDFRRSIFQFLIDQHWCQVIKQVQIQARPKVLRPGVTSLAEIKSQWWRM